MKKASIIAIVCIATLLAGCGKSESGGTSQSVSISEVSAVSDISYVAMLPSIEDSFPDGKVNVIISDGGSDYCVQVTGYKDGEYEKYVEGCKAKGFADVLCDIYEDSNNSFEAYTEDGKYYVSLQLLKDERQVLTISCGKHGTPSD